MVDARTFRRLVRCLRAGCPVGPVRVLRRRLAGHDGFAHLSHSSHARITIRPDLSQGATEDALIHEWAHVLAWRRHGCGIADHGPEWGHAYADAYRALRAEWERRGYDRN